MLFSSVPSLIKRKDAELIVVPFWQKQTKQKSSAYPAASLGSFAGLLKAPLNSNDFTGRQGEILMHYVDTGKEPRCLLVGLGSEDKVSVESLRLVFSNVAKLCQTKAISNINLLLPTISELRHLTVEDLLRGVSEGILLTNYRWEKLGTLQEETVLLKKVCLIGILPKMLSGIGEYEKIAQGVYFARDLINGNADNVTPGYLADSARKIAEKFPSVEATVFDRKRIIKEKMGLFAAVSRASAPEPAFIILSYKGHARSKEHTVIVGKGVTFDTGGLNIKTPTGMDTMRDDMSGAATALATLAVAASMKLPINVTAVVPATENAIDSNSYKPGDVYQGYSGKTVEIKDTDAEGRLILADALAYTVKVLEPSRVIDFATLTGAMVVALGDEMSGLFSNDDQLAESLFKAGQETAELLWRLPLHQSYKEDLKSDIADIRHLGNRAASATKAALFLEEFVEKTPWAHIDIAGTAFMAKEKGYWPRNGVGFGVRLMIEFLKNLTKK